MKEHITTGLFIGLTISTVTTAAIFFFFLNSHPKLAYVDSQKLLANYEGMQQAQKAFQAKAVAWQANVDTLGKALQVKLAHHEKNLTTMTKREKQLSVELLKTKKQQLQQYQQAVGQKAQEEEQKAMQAVLEEVNAFLEAYGKEQGYQVILAATQAGNIAYADESIDITDEVVEKLNQAFRGE
ncbi:MAG: OmpH family outer membrane protein [Flammeovirgaceae bacterium]